MEKWIWKFFITGGIGGLTATFLMLVSALCGCFTCAAGFLIIALLGAIICLIGGILTVVEAWME